MEEGGESGGREGWVHKALLPVLYLFTKECQSLYVTSVLNVKKRSFLA